MVKNKKFIICAGLHKTGTTSLSGMAEENGYKSCHTPKWTSHFEYYLVKKDYNFFADGGSHYDNQNEIDYAYYEQNYKDAFFIINIRDIKPWLISKLRHAGWDKNTIFQPDKESYLHDEWKAKSKKNNQLFIQHYFNRYINLITYFLDKPKKAFILDICGKNINQLKILLKNKKING